MKKIFCALAFFALPVLADEPPPVIRNPSIVALVAEAEKFIAKEMPEPIYKGSGKKRVLIGKESLRATLSPSGALRLIRLNLIQTQKGVVVRTKNGTRKKTKNVFELASVATPFCSAEKLGSGTGVSANYRIICDGREEIVLAGRELLTDGRPPWEATLYVPYSDALATNEVVMLGEFYFREQIVRAAESLRKKEVSSRAISGRLVADIFPEEMLFRLALIEHIDHSEYKEYGSRYMMRKVLTQLGTNGSDAFIYAKSKDAGALCLMQIMPSTYNDKTKKNKNGKVVVVGKGIRSTYPEAKLPLSAVMASCSGHSQAIEVAYLVLDEKLSYMPDSFQKKFLANPGNYGLYLAAAYNGGQKNAYGLYLAEEKKGLGLSGVLKNLFERLGIKKERRSLSKILREETWVYLKKYFELSNIPNANGE